MKIRFATSPVLLSALSVVLTMSLAGAAYATEKELVYVSKVEVTKIKDGRFKVTASGDTPSAGWKVMLQPVTYVKEPEIWLIDASGKRPDGAVAQMMMPWKQSIEMGLGPTTRKVAVNGRGGKALEADVPHGSAEKTKETKNDKGNKKGKEKKSQDKHK